MFSSIRTFVICLSMLQLVQVMGSGYSKSALTSIERRYRLSTFSVGILQSCFHVGNLSVILFVSYFGSKWNRPRAIAIGSLIMAVSSFLSAMPQFIGSRYHVEEAENFGNQSPGISSRIYMTEILNGIFNATEKQLPRHTAVDDSNAENLTPMSLLSLKKSKTKLCVPKQQYPKLPDEPENVKVIKLNLAASVQYSVQQVANLKSSDAEPQKLKEQLPNERKENSEYSNTEEFWNDSSLYIFIAIGSVLKGMGHSPLHPLGMSFVDDFATPRNSAVYIGVVSALSLLGPAFGFILGSLTTGTWVDWGWVDVSKIQIGAHHPLWVGAWWVGYLVTACLLLMATIPFCLFPRVMSKEEDDKEENTESACITCFRRCYTDHSASSISEDQSDVESDPVSDSSIGNSNDKNICECRVEIRENNFQDGNSNVQVSKTTFHACNEELKENKYEINDKAYFNASTNITDNFDETKAARLISYLEKGDIGSDVIASKNLIPFSYSEMKFPPSRSHSVISQTFMMKRSASVPSDGNTNISRLQAKFFNGKRKSNASAKTENSRRPSRLERLPLFDFTTSLKGLLTDVVFLSITLAFVCLTSFLAASVTYVSKYMETQFSVTASFANLLNGSVNLPMAVVGNLLGGWLIRRFNLNVRRAMAVVVTGLAMTIVCVATLLFFKCSQGSNVEYSSAAVDGGECASACNCDDQYAPVCDVTTNITYKSACHAGCIDVSSWRKTKVYSGCRCVNNGKANLTQPFSTSGSTVPNWGSEGAVLFRGPCHRPDCSKSHLPVFLGVMGTASLTAGLASTPSTLVILRIVPPAEKAFAIGIVFVFTRILAWIPAPVYVGYVIDSACLRWSYIGSIAYPDDVTSAAGNEERNHCEIYDKDRLRRNFFAATGGLLVLSLLFYMLALYLQTRRARIRRLKFETDKDDISFESPVDIESSVEQSSDLMTSQPCQQNDYTSSRCNEGENDTELAKEKDKLSISRKLVASPQYHFDSMMSREEHIADLTQILNNSVTDDETSQTDSKSRNITSIQPKQAEIYRVTLSASEPILSNSAHSTLVTPSGKNQADIIRATAV